MLLATKYALSLLVSKEPMLNVHFKKGAPQQTYVAIIYFYGIQVGYFPPPNHLLKKTVFVHQRSVVRSNVCNNFGSATNKLEWNGIIVIRFEEFFLS